jgi:formyltetrahydrofolate-dependent phosphoribosylglycinamide formyltransferase
MAPRIIILISGSGTNLQAIIDAVHDQRIRAEIPLVVSNRRNAYGLVRAQKAGIPTKYFPLKPYRDAGKGRDEYDADLAREIQGYKPDLVVLAGWMHILSPAFLDKFPNQVINLHPALPGAFAGINAVERTFEAYQAQRIQHGGCMVHYVVPEIDAGPVIVQEIVPIHASDTLDDFMDRLHATEHRIIVEAVQIALAS